MAHAGPRYSLQKLPSRGLEGSGGEEPEGRRSKGRRGLEGSSTSRALEQGLKPAEGEGGCCLQR